MQEPMRHLVDMAQNCAPGWQRRTEILHAGLIIAHRVGDIGRIPVVPALGVIVQLGPTAAMCLWFGRPSGQPLL